MLKTKDIETGEFIDITVYKGDIYPLGFSKDTLYDSFIRIDRSNKKDYQGKIYILIKNYIKTPASIEIPILRIK